MQKYLYILLFSFFINTINGQNLYDINSIKDVRISFEQENWDQILDSLKRNGNDKRIIASVSVNGVKLDSVGIRYKGNSSYFNVRKYKSSKLPFNIKASHIKKKQRFAGGYKTLKLSNVFRDPSFVREVLSYEIARRYMPAPKANFIRLYVNEEYLGLYNSTESVDKDFLDKYYGEHKGVFFKCDPKWDSKSPKNCTKESKAALAFLGTDSLCYQNLYEIKSDNGWAELIQLIKTLNKDSKKIESILDVDQTLWMIAFNNVLANLDSYTGRLCHNYYMYQDSFGIFHPVVWDMNLSFGGFRFEGEGRQLTNEELQKISPFLHYKNFKKPLISKLLQQSLFRKIYVAHVRTILEEYFSNNLYESRMRSVQSAIDHDVKNDKNKLYTYEQFIQNRNETSEAGKAKIIGLTELMKARTKYLQNHPIIKKEAPIISQQSHRKLEDKILINANLQKGNKLYLAYRYGKFGPFKRIEMKDDGNSNDRTAADFYFGISIEKKEILQYYFIAEADKTAALLPKRASFEFFEIK